MLEKVDIVGVWTLEQFIVHRASDEATHCPIGPNETPIYTVCGHVSVAKNRDPLPNPTARFAPRLELLHQPLRAGCGTCRVTHTPLQSSLPSVIGVPTTPKQQLRIEADGRLWLLGIGLKERVTLVWRRKS